MSNCLTEFETRTSSVSFNPTCPSSTLYPLLYKIPLYILCSMRIKFSPGGMSPYKKHARALEEGTKENTLENHSLEDDDSGSGGSGGSGGGGGSGGSGGGGGGEYSTAAEFAAELAAVSDSLRAVPDDAMASGE